MIDKVSLAAVVVAITDVPTALELGAAGNNGVWAVVLFCEPPWRDLCDCHPPSKP